MTGAGSDRVLARLAGVVGSTQVVTDPEITAAYAIDWTGRFRGATPAVVRPGTVDEVAEVVSICAEEGVAVVPQGGNTGLVGGGVPLRGEVVLSLRRLSSIGRVDPVAHQVTAGAGVTLAGLAEHVAPHGLAYAVDLAARDSATVGGMVATNAGGVHLLRWGGTRQQVVGIEAVLGDGSVVRHLAGLAKDNTGYDLGALLCGSEGTLGVVTAARLALVPRFEHRVVALVAFETLAAAVAAVGHWRGHLEGLDAAEVFFADGLGLVCRVEQLPMPFGHEWPVYVLAEVSARTDPVDRVGEVIDATDGTQDVAVGVDERTRAGLWAYRELHTSAINTLGPPHKLDVTVPLRQLDGFVDAVRATVERLAPTARTWLFGHLGDGNLHVNITGVAPDDERVDAAVVTLVADLGGSISAEHGIGTAKKQWLHLNRSPAEIAAFRAIKHALDPHGILNPNALLPGLTSYLHMPSDMSQSSDMPSDMLFR